MEIRSSSLIAIVGAGTMGVGIAQVAAAAGHPVVVLDTAHAALERGRIALASSLDDAVNKGRIDQAEAEAIRSRIRWSDDLASASGAALVIEAIVEDLEIKRRLFGGLARVVKATTVLASNTSSLAISAIADQLALRGRFLGLHFFNPVPAMKLVEIVAGDETDAAVAQAMVELMGRWGKKPVRVRDVAGFIVNRVARPYYAEGFAALDVGVEAATVDAALTAAGGFRMGPLALADLIGHDVNYAVAASVFDAGVGAARFRPQPAQRALVDEKRLGRKAGRGVFDYGHPLSSPVVASPAAAPLEVRVSEAGLLQPLIDAAERTGIAVFADEALPVETIAVDGVIVALGDGRPLAKRPEIDVLIDHARDAATAVSIVITGRNAVSSDRAAALLQAAGKQVLVIADRPGQLVLRTLAQLANAAGDTVSDGIASAHDVDIAMRFGANHPEGPLSWAGRVGFDRVRTALDHLAAETADPIYAPSRYFGAGNG